LRKLYCLKKVTAGGAMHLAHACETIAGQAFGAAHDCRPETFVHERDLAVDQAADEDLRSIADGSRQAENDARLRVRPPVAAYTLAGDCVDQRRDLAAPRRFADDAVALDERERLLQGHDAGRLRRSCCHSTSPWPDARASTRASTNSR